MDNLLGRLHRVDLRTVWTNEATSFTPWLSQPENLALLGEAIGCELSLEGQEQNVGPFRADLLCKDASSDRWVLIENQIERTDHGHLGQLLTYAAGLQAVTIIWIAARFTDEHRAALDWLNEGLTRAGTDPARTGTGQTRTGPDQTRTRTGSSGPAQVWVAVRGRISTDRQGTAHGLARTARGAYE